MSEGKYKIDFLADEHIYFVNGEVKPSVTQILKSLSDFSNVHPSVLEKACGRGTELHLMCHQYLTDLVDPAIAGEYPEILRGFVGWFENRRNQYIFDRLYSETMIYCSRLDVCGTPDLFFENGDLYDLKFGNWKPESAGPQTAAYAEMIDNVMGIKIKRRYVLAPDKNGKFREYLLDNRSDIGVFKQLREKYTGE